MIRSENPRSSAKILIVDDEPQNRRLLEVMLSLEDFELSTASNGEEALAMIARNPPDLILLDVLMPGMGGYEVVGKIKANDATKNIPIILVTSLDDRNAKISGLSVGAEDFLSKPVDRGELRMRVRNLLRLKVHSDDAVAHRDDSMGMVSHELRNLLSGISLNATLITETSADSQEGHRNVDRANIIRRLSARMDRLVGDLVDVVSIDAGKLALKTERSDAFTLLAEIVEASTHAAADHGISLRFDSEATTLLGEFDRGRLLQVLTNLVGNAMKFTPRGGAIVLRGERQGDDLHLSVSDTGPGIAKNMLEAVFERFLQVNDTDQRGLGLGLYICKCIVESHGGKIWADSKLGEGTAFHFTIPGATDAMLTAEGNHFAESPAVEEQSAKRPPSARGRSGNILVIDDDRAMCETIATYLARRGFAVTWETAAAEALALLEVNDFDAILTDLHMNEMDGLSVCASAHLIRPGIPVIVATAFATEEMRASAFSAGAYEYINKPFDLEQLGIVMNRAVLTARNARADHAHQPS